jgi:hypothetical protein
MEKYFVAHLGIQKGPWSIEEITLRLNQKNLLWNDYIYDEKNKDWILILESPLFTNLFNNSFKIPIKSTISQKMANDPVRDRSWYILKQENNYGPFSQLEMIQMLQSKTLFEFDFIWRHGLDSWKRLAEVLDYKPEKIKEIFENLKSTQTSTDKEIFFRRKHARAQYGSSLILHDRKKLFRAESFEISAGGAGFISNEIHFELDKQLYLHFKPSDQVPAFNAICKVVSHVGDKYGVKFLHVSAAAKEKITQFTSATGKAA